MDEPGVKEPVKTILSCPVEEATPDNLEAIGPVCSRPGTGLHNSQILIENESKRDSENEMGSEVSQEIEENSIGLDRQQWPGLSIQCRGTERLTWGRP